MGFELDISDFEISTAALEARMQRELEETMHDVVDDLKRISSNIAPIDKGTLRRSFDSEVKGYLNKLEGLVTASATEESVRYGRFNYALWTHEANYKLGDKSRAAQGTDGYAVGNKYLSRPLYGEARKYLDWFDEAMRRSLGE